METSSPLEAGTVVIVDPASPNRVKAAARAYDTRVAGAVSRQPGLILGERRDDRAMVSQSGRVRVKADAALRLDRRRLQQRQELLVDVAQGGVVAEQGFVDLR